ncbi:hypothetical protein V6N11_051413 [Hibiscus sabdariffa]|uniref:Uncharacterized protein n=1 Tax=Hibiscus sabdariffa TaxID=183260 RepID=A0ABR2U7N2_9ROSI
MTDSSGQALIEGSACCRTRSPGGDVVGHLHAFKHGRFHPSPASTADSAGQALIEGSACCRTRPPGSGVVGPLHAWQPQATQVG